MNRRVENVFLNQPDLIWNRTRGQLTDITDGVYLPRDCTIEAGNCMSGGTTYLRDPPSKEPNLACPLGVIRDVVGQEVCTQTDGQVTTRVVGTANPDGQFSLDKAGTPNICSRDIWKTVHPDLLILDLRSHGNE